MAPERPRLFGRAAIQSLTTHRNFRFHIEQEVANQLEPTPVVDWKETKKALVTYLPEEGDRVGVLFKQTSFLFQLPIIFLDPKDSFLVRSSVRSLSKVR